jgi:membrane protein DedA with SNARE-associated domain
MGFSDSLTFGVEAIIGLLIFVIFFTSLAPTVIDTINNNSSYVGLPQATILIFSLILLVFVAGIAMRMWKKVSGQEPPQNGYPQMGGY